MVQRRSGPCLASKSLQRLRVFGNIIRQKFQRNESPQRSVFRFVDNTIPPPPNFSTTR
jgi:hypothetical protein